LSREAWALVASVVFAGLWSGLLLMPVLLLDAMFLSFGRTIRPNDSHVVHAGQEMPL
jgi:hypothetical protein